MGSLNLYIRHSLYFKVVLIPRVTHILLYEKTATINAARSDGVLFQTVNEA